MSISERTLWSYATQLTNVLRCIHGHGLAARCIEPSKVLRTGKNRVRLNGCSVFDVIAYDPRASASTLAAQQGEDLLNLGKLLVSLACNSMAAVQNLPKSLEQVTRSYSAELKNLILWLLGKPAPSKTADELGRLLGSHVADEVDSALNYADLLESGLSKELENARLVRLLCKFGFINERPECVLSALSLFTPFCPWLTLCSSASRFDHDPRWSETGDRYIIKLFRDHVFHAVDDAGRPVVDLSHILTNLNKLDAGSEEKMMLTSRDEQSCLVVSYREVSVIPSLLPALCP
jgi:PAB-dependent poly(A)-specific ribonuclease subunit 3